MRINYKNRRKYVLHAVRKALEARINADIKSNVAINPFDYADIQNIPVRFVDIPSLEGMYVDDPLQILIGSQRPITRQAFTCAHELGHHYYGHLKHIDQYIDSPEHASDDQEFVADCFASFFLMPKQTIERGLSVRGIDLKQAKPIELYNLACWLGVSFTALLNHLCLNLRIISNDMRERFGKIKRSDLRFEIAQVPLNHHLTVVDQHWTDRTIDVSVNEYVMIPDDVEFDGACLSRQLLIGSQVLYQSICPGIGNFISDARSWSNHIRVSRQNYAGLSKYRHLEE